MSKRLLQLVLIVISSASFGECTAPAARPEDVLLEGYDKDVNPDFPNPTTVTIDDLGLLNVVRADNDTYQVEWILQPEFSWYDARLRWSSEALGNITSVFIPKTRAWVPDTYILIPELTEKLVEDIHGVPVIKVLSDGEVIYKPIWRARTTCDLEWLNTEHGAHCFLTIRPTVWAETLINLELPPESEEQILWKFSRVSKYELLLLVVDRVIENDYAILQYGIIMRRGIKVVPGPRPLNITFLVD